MTGKKVYGEQDGPKNLQREENDDAAAGVSWSENAEKAGALFLFVFFGGGHLEVGFLGVRDNLRK